MHWFNRYVGGDYCLNRLFVSICRDILLIEFFLLIYFYISSLRLLTVYSLALFHLVAPPEAVFAREVKKLQQEQLKPQEQLTLEPYERDHAVVVGVYRPPPKK